MKLKEKYYYYSSHWSAYVGLGFFALLFAVSGITLYLHAPSCSYALYPIDLWCHFLGAKTSACLELAFSFALLSKLARALYLNQPLKMGNLSYISAKVRLGLLISVTLIVVIAALVVDFIYR